MLIIDFFLRGGFFMGALLLLSVISLSIIFQRIWALRLRQVIPSSLKLAVDQYQTGTSLEPLSQQLQKNDSPLSRILQTLIHHSDWPRAEALDAVEVRARHEIARLETGLTFLEIGTGIAPLLGLLGTLSGLVDIFANIGDKGDPQLVAVGISQALNSTIVGLAVAVPCLIAFHYLSRRVEMIAIEIEAVTAELITKIYLKK
ncbi:MAG: MotA/TolQ/ExbB proton channel family protein [Chthoniobacterales bacterium]|nr:MotA/TolQ/ExbB proton channel family protein [Chthoniobacterales bacterium]